MLRGFAEGLNSFDWTPSIGDPTFIGWLTVLLYFVASISCWRSGGEVERRGRDQLNEPRAWRFMSMLFLFLGVNKQLDLQSALTEFGRAVARYQDWYAERQSIQIYFIGLVALACLMMAVTLLIWMRRAPMPTWLALLGTIMVLGYVLIRAASFHHIDRFIGETILGLRWNWVIEIGGITLVLASSHWRRKTFRHSPLRKIDQTISQVAKRVRH
jgi:hypothetical protein